VPRCTSSARRLIEIVGDPFFSELESDARYRNLMPRPHLPIRR
jgi:hypothetical protein